MTRIPFSARHRVRALVAAIGIVGVSVALSGFAPASDSGGTTTITFSYLWTGEEAKALQQVVADYNKSQSAIHVDAVSNPDQTKQLASMSSSNGSFDVSDSFGSNVGSWASKGILAPLDGYHINTSDFIPSVMKDMKYDGKLYALPIAVQEYKLIYNKKLFAEAGITAPPTTMAEFATDIAKTTKVDANGTITQLGLGTLSPYDLLTTLAFVFGGKWDTDGKPSPMNANNIKALDWYQKNVTDKYGAANIAKFEAGFGEYMTAQDPFYTGKIAMTLDGEWQSSNIAKVAPNLQWGAADIPAVSPSLENATQTYNSMFFIPANSKHKPQAAKFLEYLTGKKAMLTFTKALGNLPARTSLLDNPAYNSLPNFDVWLRGLKSKNAFSMASATYTNQYNTDLTSAMSSMALGQLTPTQAMEQVAQKAKSYGN